MLKIQSVHLYIFSLWIEKRFDMLISHLEMIAMIYFFISCIVVCNFLWDWPVNTIITCKQKNNNCAKCFIITNDALMINVMDLKL